MDGFAKYSHTHDFPSSLNQTVPYEIIALFIQGIWCDYIEPLEKHAAFNISN